MNIMKKDNEPVVDQSLEATRNIEFQLLNMKKELERFEKDDESFAELLPAVSQTLEALQHIDAQLKNMYTMLENYTNLLENTDNVKKTGGVFKPPERPIPKPFPPRTPHSAPHSCSCKNNNYDTCLNQRTSNCQTPPWSEYYVDHQRYNKPSPGHQSWWVDDNNNYWQRPPGENYSRPYWQGIDCGTTSWPCRNEIYYSALNPEKVQNTTSNSPNTYDGPDGSWDTQCKEGINQSICPSLNLYDNGDDYCIYVELPGVDKKSLDLRVDEQCLWLSAKTTVPETQDGEPLLLERNCPEYCRRIDLPCNIIPNKTTSTYKNGILYIKLVKSSTKKRSHKVKIQ